MTRSASSGLFRRRFLRWAAAGAAAPALAPLAGLVTGGSRTPRARALDPDAPSYLIEICMRDQLDWGHFFVAPSLARATDLRRGETGRQVALFYQQSDLTEAAPNVFLTPESAELQPHVDTIAMVELCDLTDGPVHGHEAANPVRSPGRTRSSGGGRIPMWQSEPGGSNSEGSFYSQTPTPASLHNYWQKQLTPGIRNGLAIKGTSRHFGMYHFGAGLAGAELDRVQSIGSLFEAFPRSVEDFNIVPTAAEADLVERYLRRVDRRSLGARGYADSVITDHSSQLADARLRIHGEPRIFDLTLSEEERAYWSAGMPSAYGRTEIDLWEQAAYAFKLVSNDVVRTVALEVDIGDIHGERTRSQMRDQTLTTVVPIARLIESLKLAGIYDRTLIVAFTLDGGRAPAAGSSGDEGKNGAILAGGMIRGGYYGDIRIAGNDGDGHSYSYHMPDLDTGAPVATGTTGNGQRLGAAHLWRTIVKAAGVPDAVASTSPDVSGARALPWLLRA